MGRDDHVMGGVPQEEGGASPPSAPPGTSRRSLLTKGAALVAGAVGASVLASSAALGALVHQRRGSTLTLYVRDIRFRTPARRRRLASRHTVATRRLVDASGQSVGSFSAGVLAGSGGGIAVQRFNLADGTIIGMGSGGLGGDYAVVGGTGRYAGATGTYSTQVSAGERGRDAAFRISLTGTKG